MRKAVRAIVIHGDKLLVMHRNKFGKEYYTLVGGGVDAGETNEQSLFREVQEESSLTVANPRLVYIDMADNFYGPQYVYLCDYVSGEPHLAEHSEEAHINKLEQNLYTPLWLPLEDLPDVPFVSPVLRSALLESIDGGFPTSPIELK
jgi:ADP-ribose pyrophosphatase YjhB (NUDIX family)